MKPKSVNRQASNFLQFIFHQVLNTFLLLPIIVQWIFLFYTQKVTILDSRCPNSIDSWTTKIKQTLNSYTIRHLNTYDKTTKQPIGYNQHNIRKHPRFYNNFALTKRSSSSCPPPPTKTVQPIQLKIRLLLSLPFLAIYYIMASETATRSHHLRNQNFQIDDESKLFSTKPLVQIFSLEFSSNTHTTFSTLPFTFRLYLRYYYDYTLHKNDLKISEICMRYTMFLNDSFQKINKKYKNCLML